MKANKVRKRVIIPVSFVLLILLAGAIFGPLSAYNKNSQVEMERPIRALPSLLDTELRHARELLLVRVQQITSNSCLNQKLANEEMDELNTCLKENFIDLQENNQVEYLNFYSADRQPITRLFTEDEFPQSSSLMSDAHLSSEPTAGLDLDNLGRTTYWVLIPWVEQGELLGYFEIGKDISANLRYLSQSLNINLLEVVPKQNLDVQKWLVHARKSGNTARWTEYEDVVLARKFFQGDTLEIDDVFMDAWYEKPETQVDINLKSQVFQAASLPLAVSDGEPLSYLVILNDVSSNVEGARRTVFHMSLLAAVVGVGLVVFFWNYLGGVEQEIISSVEKEKIANQKLMESELLYRSIFNGVNDAIFLETLTGEVLDVNDRACEMFGWSREEFLTKTVQDMVPPENRALLPAEQSPEDFHETLETVNIRADGTRFPVAITGSVQQIGDQPRLLVVVRDISKQKAAERDLRRAKDNAEAADQAKSEFLANMSHEIRTPMNGIIGMIKLALDTELTAEQLDYLLTAQESADSLLTLINDILDFSKIEAGHLDLDLIDFDLVNAVEGVARTLAPKAEEKGLELISMVDPGIHPLLLGDPGRIRQILINLVGNAIKFTESGEILLKTEITADSPGKTKLKISVQDTGIGIPEEMQKEIFNRFEQVDGSTTREYGGTGLGLAISRQLVDLMNGEIGVASEPGVGSTFWFEIELLKQPTTARRTIPIPLRDVRILAVDDNLTNQRVLKQTLEKNAARVDLASSGLSALGQLKQAAEEGDPYRIILLDMQMPEMDGKKVLQQMKDTPEGIEAEIIILTSMGMQREAPDLKQLGAAGYLVKPVRQQQLIEVMETVLGQKEQLRSGEEKELITTQSLFRKERQEETILLAEDNLVNQKLAVALLQKAGYSVEVVDTGAKALEAVKQARYGLVLMDVQMPEMDGLEATRKIRELEQEEDRDRTPIIAMTAHALKGDRERCLEAGMDEYLSKPLNHSRLIEIIKLYLEK